MHQYKKLHKEEVESLKTRLRAAYRISVPRAEDEGVPDYLLVGLCECSAGGWRPRGEEGRDEGDDAVDRHVHLRELG